MTVIHKVINIFTSLENVSSLILELVHSLMIKVSKAEFGDVILHFEGDWLFTKTVEWAMCYVSCVKKLCTLILIIFLQSFCQFSCACTICTVWGLQMWGAMTFKDLSDIFLVFVAEVWDDQIKQDSSRKMSVLSKVNPVVNWQTINKKLYWHFQIVPRISGRIFRWDK